VTAGSGARVTASEAQNGSTLSLHRGDTLTVTLHNTYWTMDGSSNAGVLRAQGPATTQGDPPSSRNCVPGGGCGTVTQSFAAVSTGGADVTANRTTCGEALRCTTPEQSHWVVHVVVRG
ncbi:MAG TPA: hypothetical protein VH134_11270, partial [Candidatus Dormibacteraeota bacterium]|nr:hypothetical protein [Candidatus Dormibacteraeota bacterium]